MNLGYSDSFLYQETDKANKDQIIDGIIHRLVTAYYKECQGDLAIFNVGEFVDRPDSIKKKIQQDVRSEFSIRIGSEAIDINLKEINNTTNKIFEELKRALKDEIETYKKEFKELKQI